MFDFSYNLSRPYPFRWFTLLVIASGVALTALFTIVNLISSGYTLVAEYSPQANSTLSQRMWFNHWPHFLSSKLKPSCQPALLEVNSNFFTNYTALTYVLDAITSITDNNAHFSLLTYRENLFHDCSINWIQIDMDAHSPSAQILAKARWNPDVTASITCHMISPVGPVQVNMSTEYNLVNRAQFPIPSSKSTESLFWAQSSLTMFWVSLEQAMEDSVGFDQNPYIDKGTIVFTPNKTITDIQNPGYFNITWDFLQSDGNINCGGRNVGQDCSLNYTGNGNYPKVWPVSDRLAKSFQSTIFNDLGQAATQNILNDANHLQNFTSYFEAILKTAHSNPNTHIFPEPATEGYDSVADTTEPLQTLPSVISTSYLCQVPKRKSTGSLLVAVVTQDLVFLSASWKLFTFLIGYFMLRKRPTANYCEGCMLRDDGHELPKLNHSKSYKGYVKAHDSDRGENQQRWLGDSAV